MKFTIVFPSHEHEDLSVGAVFIPCLVWIEGRQELLNPHPDDPHYRKGDLQRLMQHTDIKHRLAEDSKHVTVIVHPCGHGDASDMDGLVSDLRDQSFLVRVVQHGLQAPN